MIAVAGFSALAGSMFLAALRLVTRYDKAHGRSYIVITSASRLYVLLHGFAALLPFPIYFFWAKKWSFLISFSPWFLAAVALLMVNRMLKLEGLDFPEATGRLSKLREDVRGYINQRMANEEFASVRTFIAPYAKGRSLCDVRELALLSIPLQLRKDRASACRKAIETAETVDEAMELYVRHIGKEAFRCVFEQKPEEETPPDDQLLLFELKSRRSSRPLADQRIAAFSVTLQ